MANALSAVDGERFQCPPQLQLAQTKTRNGADRHLHAFRELEGAERGVYRWAELGVLGRGARVLHALGRGNGVHVRTTCAFW